LHHVGRYYGTVLLNRELVSRAKLCLVSVLPDIVKDCPTMRHLPKIFLRSFENVAPDLFPGCKGPFGFIWFYFVQLH